MTPQLPLWSDDIDHTPNTPHITDARPLPLLVAEKWQFSLQHHVVDDVYYFAAIDWVGGMTGKRTAARSTYAKLKKSLGDELLISIQQLNYKATDGKTYQLDFLTEDGLYTLTQSMRSTKNAPAVAEIKSYLVDAGVLVDKMRRDPAAAAQVSDQLDKLHGRVREDSIDARKFFTVAAQDTHYLNKPKIGLLTNENYKALFGLAKRELCMELGLSPDSNALRDNMNRYALLAITAVETHAAELMRQLGRPLTDDEQITVGRKTAAQFRPVFEVAASEVGQTLTDARLGAPVAKRVKS